MKIEPFGVEIWMNAHETACAHNIAETCVDSITFGDLMSLAGKSGEILGELVPLKLTYGAIEGSARLRTAIASLYHGRAAEEVLVTHGAIGANALLYEALIEPGDEIVSVVPNYQQHYSIPESYGATVKRLRLRADTGYLPDLAELSSLVTAKTKLIALTNPNNPTGAVMDEVLLRGVAEIAARHGAWVICDEVYRGVDQADDGLGVSMAELYEKAIAVGGMSKAFALAGLRLGWIVAPASVLHQVSTHRDYNTISVGMIDDHVASIALENREALLKRNRAIVRANLALVERWVAKEPRISWVKPRGGTVTLLRFDAPIGSVEFCTRLLAETGVLLAPGAVFEMEGTLRIGFGNATASVTAGLDGLSRFLLTLPT
jgi:aspartate/methionine/tyrosine aminotransferase